MALHLVWVYVPPENASAVKEAVFAAGAGRLGNYEHCVWETEGVGQFRALAGSDPTIGEIGQIEIVKEVKIEFVCQSVDLDAVLKALVAVHPYEEPAYGAVLFQTLKDR